jgi:O-antigen/teichoic acid export membrane protein
MARHLLARPGHRLAYASLIQVLARGAQLATLAAGSALIARHDSAAVLGTFGLAILVFNLIQTSGDWGLTAIGAQSLVNAETGVSSGVLVRLRAQIQVPIVALTALVSTIAWLTGHEQVALGVTAGGVAGVLTNLAASMTAPFQAALRLDVPAWIDVATRLAGLAGLIAAVASHEPGWVIVVTLPATALLDLLATAIAARRFGFTTWDSTSADVAGDLLRRATPLAVLTIFGVLYLRANSLVVLALLGTARLGAYSLVFRVVDVLVMAPSVVLAVVFPVLVRLHRSDVRAYRAACQRAHDRLIAIGCALSLTAALAAEPLIHLLGGPAYLGVVTPLRILAIAGLAGFANALFAQLMIIEGLQSTVLKFSAWALLANLALSVVLVHTAHLTGAAVAAAVSETGGAAIVIGIVSRRTELGIRWSTSAWLATAAGLITGTGLVLEHLGVSALGTTVVALMLFMAGWFGSFHRAKAQVPAVNAGRA